MIRPTDSIIGPSRGTPEGWFPFVDRSNIANKAEVKQWIRDTYEVNEPDDMPDAGIVVAQAFVETGNFTNRWWKERKNAGSLGVTGDPVQNEASPTFKTTMASARAMSAHDLLYATGQINRGGLTPVDDPRYGDYREAYGTQAFPTLQGLSGRYAADVMYSITISERAQEVYSGVLSDQDEFTMPVDSPAEVVPMEITFDRVPKPLMTINHCSKIGSGHGYTELGRGRRVVGACDHITDGYGSLQFYHDFFSIGGEREANALVDYVIDRAGNIIELNDPFGSRMPWANGGTDGLEGDGPAYVSTLGVGMVNEGLISIEHVGVSPDAMTGAQLEKSAQLKAWLFDTVDVPYTSFPVNPDVGIVTHMQHFEFATKPCPGPGIRAQTSQLQARIVAIMKQYQEATIVDPPVPTTPPPPKPVSIYPKNMTLQLAKRLYGSITVPWSSKTFTFDPARSECQNWIEWGKEQLDDGDDYTKAEWPQLVDIIRRGATHNVHAYQYSNGKVFEKSIREG